MKRIISFLISIVLICSVFAGCGNSVADTNKLSIVTTIFPEYDWVNNILGEKCENADVTMLLDNGVDLHSYQPTADDIIKISRCDLFIYVGGESDKWVNDALKESTNKNMIIIDLMDILGSSVKEEEIVDGMQAEEDEEENGKPEYDEHIWLSLKNAKVCINAIKDALIKIDGENEQTYSDNAKKYTESLDKLDGEFESCVSESANSTILFGDRFPFRYLTDDYGIKYYAAFAGCSSESEASFETISFLAKKLNELGLKSVIVLEGGKTDIAETIIKTSKTKAKTVTLNSMQTTTSKDARKGQSYLKIMEQNLNVLKEVLN